MPLTEKDLTYEEMKAIIANPQNVILDNPLPMSYTVR